jgi:hypothetical protein
VGDLAALDLINRTLDRLKLARTTSITSSDSQVRQILSFANETGDDIARRKDWPELEAEWFINVGTPTTLTASTTAESATITVSSSAAISAAGAAVWAVFGNGIITGCRVASVTNATTIVLSEPVTVTQVADLTFVQDAFDLPADWKRDLPQTAWDRRNRWALLGPDTPQRDQMNRSGIVPTGPRRHMRMIGYPKRARIWPPPTAINDYPGTLSREYVSKYWAVAADGVTRKREWTLDTDLHVWDDDELIIDGIRWRYWQINGLQYEDFRRAWYEKMDAALAASEGSPVLFLGRRRAGMLLSAAQIQDGAFPARDPDA